MKISNHNPRHQHHLRPPVTLDGIMAIYSEDPYSDPMPYRYVIDIDGRILKGRPDRFLCRHWGIFSRDSISFRHCFRQLIGTTSTPSLRL